MSDTPAVPSTQRLYQFVKQPGGLNLQLRDNAPVVAPRDDEVVVRVHASSVNHRDVMMARGFYPAIDAPSVVPLSDGAGQVVARGRRAHHFELGARVAATYFRSWMSGAPDASTGSSALGMAVDGMLAQYVTVPERALVAIPAQLSYEQAASLPCAAVTAWSALFRCGRIQPRQYVLLQGTGGVSVFGLQLAVAAGALPIVISSSDAKLQRARALGAIATINYLRTPEWQDAVLEATSGSGVQQILEVGGTGTLAKSLAVLAQGGHVALIGGLAGFGGDIPAVSLISRNASATGIFVGSKVDFEQLLTFMTQQRIEPVIDRTFEFEQAKAAYDYLESAQHFGKVVIRHV
jgi:NADPH:quinone reductase-like Zn-dependent oxidoreductase